MPDRDELLALWHAATKQDRAVMWGRLSPASKDVVRSDAGLTKQLIGLEGWRVEVETTYGETRRFIVGRSTGWQPCHIERRRCNSMGGISADSEYRSVRKLYKVV